MTCTATSSILKACFLSFSRLAEMDETPRQHLLDDCCHTLLTHAHAHAHAHAMPIPPSHPVPIHTRLKLELKE